MKPKVYLIGLGLPEGKALSAESLAALKACRALFVNDPTTGWLKDLGPELLPVGEFGVGWGPEAMEEFCGRVLAAARKKPPVGLTVYGHPMVYEPLTHHLLEACRKTKTPCRVVGARSSIGATLEVVDARFPAGTGLRVSDAGHFRQTPPAVDCWTLVFQSCSDASVLREVAAHALRFYPASHRAALVEAENWYPQKVRWTPLSGLAKGQGRPPMYATLAIPPCPRPAGRRGLSGADMGAKLDEFLASRSVSVYGGMGLRVSVRKGGIQVEGPSCP
jgi:uncharacterized protein YabN with tetrapyrrole methylase and pyrophosphatase domain